ncbi:MAG: tRNA (adenosine(37)-N6)-threonylcarbamoyltransferase complex dimerization subunit type 1 TsaB [Firmicutes bacterium]|nr:tRNA (adenosine(37)-N6)-threonylcarbamoyltransferase complex dimerization subunit type 1 TsaB [Bacillota bacterium]
MYILAIETTGPYGSVALINEQNQILSHKVSKESMSHLKDLMPMVSEMLQETGIKGSDITAIACDAGPGSFTGIRIGVSTARALSQVWKVPCMKVSSLSSALFKDMPYEIYPKDGIVCVILNARRRQVYGFIDGYLKEGPWMIDDIIRIAKEEIKDSKEIIFFGDGVDSYGQILKDAFEGTEVRYIFAPEEQRYQDAVEIARVGFVKYRDGELLDYGELLPNYMREAEAETKLRAGELPISRLPKQE